MNIFRLHLPSSKPCCFHCKSTSTSTWTNGWASSFLFLSPSQANWAVLLLKVTVGVRPGRVDREGCKQEQSLKHIYKDHLAVASPPVVQRLPITFSAWANPARWRWTRGSKLVQCQTSSSPQQCKNWDSSPLHHYRDPCKSMALSLYKHCNYSFSPPHTLYF